ncbi:hypothetical protein Taro_036300 [Colocasia esculenta]|uniref:Uncharacterized protein n=1 Tax=Colocasia esculenta TaxID=4460 RepID=A0A843VX37_COLES|nr:hypothetical protein [Colocasia esculenta]
MIRTPSKVMMVSSSPGRAAEKLPAPMLTTLLRGKGGSRSRGRSSASMSRSSPMFTARRRSASVDIQEEKEPSSPKVTCIGQVRISKRKSAASGSSSSSLRSQQQQKQGGCVPRGCRCFQRGFFCNPFSKGLGVKFKPSSASASPYRHHDSRGWRKWFLLPRSGCYRQRKPPRQRQQHQQWLKEEPPRMTGVQAAVAGSDDEGERSEHGEVEEEDDDDEEETKVFVPTTPPKNALLLMRCRSAPHRPACVPDRFWASSPYGAESDNAASTAAAAPGGMEPSRGENRGEEPITVSTYEDRVGINDGGAEESREGEDYDGEAAAVGPSPSFSSRPLILTRCKSEPARRAAKLAAPDASYCFWNSGSNQSNKPRSKNSSNNNKRWLTLLGEARPIPSQ